MSAEQPRDAGNAAPSTPSGRDFVTISRGSKGRRRLFAFAGPAFLISVGYMDPGNWATDLEAGSRFRYGLLWVVLASNIVAVLLQTLSARLGVVTGRDLPQMCRATYRPPVSAALWVAAELAIIACDLAEVLGSAVAINLLFHIPLIPAVLFTVLDVLLLLVLQSRGVRLMEAVIVSLVATVSLAYLVEIVYARPDWHAVTYGLVTPRLNGESLLIALGILGATVMPHNLYLHSALVQSRRIERSPAGIQDALRFNLWDTVIALNLAFFVNAAILIVAAAVFWQNHQVITRIQDAYVTLSPLVGAPIASLLFALALLASGQASTITGTLAGQVVMEGFVHMRMAPWARRVVTRSLAIVPAVLVIMWHGRGSPDHQSKAVYDLLIWSQVALSIQLTFAVVPLVRFTSDPRIMGQFVNPLWLKACSWLVAAAIALLNLWLIFRQFDATFGRTHALGILAVGSAALAAFAMFVRLWPNPAPSVPAAETE